MSMLIALDPRGIDLAYPAELERRSDLLTWLNLFEAWYGRFLHSHTGCIYYLS